MVSPQRQQLAETLAWFFRRHLLTELEEKKKLLENSIFDGRTAYAVTDDILAQLDARFPQLASRPPAPYNFVERWTTMNNRVRYHEFSFEAYNTIFLARIADIQSGEPTERRLLVERMQYAFSKFDYQIKGMSVAFFLDSENNLREVLRELAQHCSGGQPAIELILEHSRYYQIAIFEFFEGLLRSSLADNERLLHALLPASVVSELKHNQTVAPINVPASTVLFTDFVGFTVASAAHPAEEIVAALEAYFNLFDGIMARHGLEKIKTIGDSYMAAGGVPQPQADHVNRVCLAAIEIIRLGQALTQTRREQNLVAWETRLGIHTGPVQAGIIGQRKFVYDLWGATVNFASRLEQSCEPGRIHVSAEVVAAAHPAFEFISRGPVTMKSVGTLETFYLQPNPVDASFYAQSVDAYFL